MANNDFFGGRTEWEQIAANSARKLQQEKELAARNEQAAEIAEDNARAIKVIQDQSRRALDKVVTVIRNSTTPSGGPPMATLERVSSFIGAAGTTNAVGHAIKAGQSSPHNKGATPSDALMVSMDVLQKFVETYAQDVTRGVVQAATGTRMNVPGKRIEGVDLMRMAGARGVGAKIAGVATEILTDPTSAGVGLVPWGFKAIGATVKAGIKQASRIPKVGEAYTGVARSLNKFHDIDQLPNAQAIKDAFQAGLDASGNVDITKMAKSMRRLAVPGGTGTRLPSLRGQTFQQPVADLIEKEWQASFLNFPRNTVAEKTLGGMKDVTTLAKKAVTMIDPLFHVRNLADNVYKTYLEKVSAGDYWSALVTKYNKTPAGLKERAAYAEKGIINQVGTVDIQGGGWISKIATALNDIPRLAMAKSIQSKGGTLSEAGRLVNQTMIDYRPGMTSPMINALSNRYIPFAKYEVGNPWTYMSSMPRYSGRQSMAEKFQRNTEDNKEPWRRSPNDRGRMSAFGWTGLQTSYEDLLSTGDKGAIPRLFNAVNPLIKLIAEKVTGWDSWRGRPLQERESGKRFESMPSVFKNAMDMRPDGTISGPRLQTLSVFNRGIGMGSSYLDAAEGKGSWLQSLTGIRPLDDYQPWMQERERRSINPRPSSWKMPWSDAWSATFGASEAQAAERPRGYYQVPVGGNTRVPKMALRADIIPAWAAKMADMSAGGGQDPTLSGTNGYFGIGSTPGPSPAELNNRFYTDRFMVGGVIPAEEKARQDFIKSLERFTNEVGKLTAKGAPIGSQTAMQDMADIKALQTRAYYENMPANQLNAAVAGIKRRSQPLAISSDKEFAAIQGNRDEANVIKDINAVRASRASWLAEQREQSIADGPQRIAAEVMRGLRGQIFASEKAGEVLTPETLQKMQTTAQASIAARIVKWEQEMERAVDDIGDYIANSQVDPILAIQMKGESAVQKWRHSKSAIEMASDPDRAYLVDEKANAIAADFSRQVEKERTKQLQAEATQLEAYFKEKSAAASAILKQTFEAGQTGVSAYFAAQRNTINTTADQQIEGHTGTLGVASQSIAGSYFQDSMINLAKSGNFEELNKNREALQNAGVDVEAFFKAAAEIAQIIFARSKEIAANATAEQDAKTAYASAIANLQADTAGTNIKTREASLEGPTLADLRGNFTSQFDAQSKEQRIAHEKRLKFTELSGDTLDAMNFDDAKAYYDKKAALEANDEARERLRVESLVKIDRDYWAAKVSQAQVGTDMLTSLMTQLYELSGKKSRELFILMKAASVASAIVKGYESAVSSFAAGSKLGGPYVGAAFAAISMAMTSAQIAQIVSQQMAKGGPVIGGSGTKDDVPIMGMGGEYMIQKKAVNKYGVNFMNAINEGKAEPRDFVIPSVPSRSRSGPGYAEGGLVSSSGAIGETKIVLENKTNQNMKMSDGGMKFDGKKMVKSIILELADTDPSFAGMLQGGR